MSYIVSTNGLELIAVTSENLASGTEVKVAWNKVAEAIDASREYNLVNAWSAKVSNASKWAEVNRRTGLQVRATQINPCEFHLD